jgi:DNA-3-methyladenine glycosylase I
MTCSRNNPQCVTDLTDTDNPSEWYSKKVWGKRQIDDNALFEVMCLQVFQTGLSWRMIIERRDAFRENFYCWAIEKVANLKSDEVDLLLQNPKIIRNRRKIEACVFNARVIRLLQERHGSFCHWYYHILQGDDLDQLHRVLRQMFKFMGPEITRMWLLASGRINPDR